MTSPAILYVDGDPEGKYLDTIILPPNWGMVHSRERKGLGAAMSWFYDAHPSEFWYGWLADDLRPRTQGFDKKLEEAAGEWGFACSADGWMQYDPAVLKKLEMGHDMAGALCWGGELIRAAGAWAFLPHVGIDVAWCLVNSNLNNARYCPHVMVEHLQYKNGKRPKDLTDMLTVPESKLYQDGIRALMDFNGGGNDNPNGPMMQMVAKIKRAMGASQ